MLSALMASMLIATPAATRPRLPNLASDDAVIAFTDKVITLNRLSTRVGCLQYSADTSNRSMIYVNVIEIHSRKCGGDPGVVPVLFSLKYDLKHQMVLTDEGSVEDKFRPIRTP